MEGIGRSFVVVINSNKMRSWFNKNGWWVIGLPILGLLPLIINWLIICHNPFNWKVVGDETHWLAFWGSYISEAATALVAFLTIKNHRELKILQINSIQFSQEQTQFQNLRNILSDMILALDTKEIAKAILLNSRNLTMTSDSFAMLLMQNLQTQQNSLELLIPKGGNSVLNEYKGLVKKLSEEYFLLLSKAGEIIYHLICLNEECKQSEKLYHELREYYERKSPGVFVQDMKKYLDQMLDKQQQIKKKADDIKETINECSEFYQDQIVGVLVPKSKELIDIEQKRIENLLKGSI